MLDKEPLVFPSRSPRRFPFEPGVPDRQLWAIGMIVVQWSMTETIVDNSIHALIAGDAELMQEFKTSRNFQQKLILWQTLLELKATEPLKTNVAALMPAIQALSSQRDDVVHRCWGGGFEDSAMSASMAEHPLPTTDAGMMPKITEKLPDTNRAPMRWLADFQRLRRMAREMATLNSQLFLAVFLPPMPGEGGQSEIAL